MEIKYPINGYAPGKYWIRSCNTCKSQFSGDKYSRICEICAINALQEYSIFAKDRIKKLEDALNLIKPRLNKDFQFNEIAIIDELLK